MKLNDIEWSEAKEILLNLVEILEPLIENTVPHSFFISKCFSLSPQDRCISTLKQRSPTHLLITLHSVHEQVEKWIGEKAIERDIKKTEPILKQAHLLLHQVRIAIGKLSTSRQIQQPARRPVQQTLKSLQPELKKMIEAISGFEEVSEPGKQAQRLPLPKPHRQELLEKFTSFERSEDPLSAYERPISMKRRGGERQVSESLNKESRSLLLVDPLAPVFKSLGEANTAPLEKTVLQAAPFTPLLRNLPSLKKKKKRKKLWSSEEDEDHNNS